MTEENKPTLRLIQLFSDGACSGNPGPGGWAYILRDVLTKKEREGSGGNPCTTNNQMELQAVIEGLKALSRPCRVELYSDSNYVLQGLTSWMAGWKKKNWMRKNGTKLEPVKNKEQWQELDALVSKHSMSYHHVRGHSGHVENERCDVLAVNAYQKYLAGAAASDRSSRRD